MRMFQALLAVIALVTGVGTVFSLKAVSDSSAWPLLVAPVLLGLAFVWAFGATLRAPTSYVAISDTGTRIRFAGFVDTVVANGNIVGARLMRWPLLGGLGVRTAFLGDVALASAWGEAAELTFREPVRVWLVPRVIPVKARRLTLTVRNPEKMVERFGLGSGGGASLPTRGARKMRSRGPRTR